jgi:hypothetical protein
LICVALLGGADGTATAAAAVVLGVLGPGAGPYTWAVTSAGSRKATAVLANIFRVVEECENLGKQGEEHRRTDFCYSLPN